MDREEFWSIALILGAGVVLSNALLVLEFGSFETTVMLILGCTLAAISSSLGVAIEPGARISLAPVVVLTLSQALGYEAALLAAGISGLFPLYGAIKSMREALLRSAEAILSFAIAQSASNLMSAQVGAWAGITALTILYIGMLYVFDLVRASLRERVRIGRLLSVFGRNTFLHYGFLLAASVVALWTHRILGLFGGFLALIVLMEVYYPIKLLADQRALFRTSLQMISNAVDLKDPYTAHHSRRVAKYAVAIARRIGLPEKEVERIRIGALMHDIGKIGVPGSIIRKPSRLTEEEMETMRQHVELGERIIGDLEILSESVEIVRGHHERIDGLGYPSGVKAEDIPIGSRIILVADAFDALTTDRPYRKAKSLQDAIKVLRENSGSQFDPRAIAALEWVLAGNTRLVRQS